MKAITLAKIRLAQIVIILEATAELALVMVVYPVLPLVPVLCIALQARTSVLAQRAQVLIRRKAELR